MVTTIENRLWLAVHLLYSNASQAFDVYQAVVLQAEHAINNQDAKVVFARLAQVYDKIPAISSNLAFYEFEFEEIDQWKIIYKNSQKNQLIIFVGMLIFELNINDVAPAVKLAPEKAQFLFHQIFKKLASTSQKLKYNDQLEFKKQNDNKISYLYTYENLVDYCLQQLNSEDTEKVVTGLKLYPTLQVAKEEYSRIINQIQNLKVQKDRTTVPINPRGKNQDRNNLKLVKEGVEDTETDISAKPSKFRKWMQISSGVITIGILIFFIQPQKLYQKFKMQLGGTVVIQEIERGPVASVAGTNAQDGFGSSGGGPKNAIDQNTKPPSGADLAASTGSNMVAKSKGEVVNEKAVKPAPTTTVAATTNPTPPVNGKTSAASANAKVDNSPPPLTGLMAEVRSPGGLFRGTLIVKDFANTNEAIKAKLMALGAVKAGEVDLGWLKAPDMAYYHYTLSEERINDLETYLKSVGNLRLKFEKHPRQIPPGTRRFIIEVKDN